MARMIPLRANLSSRTDRKNLRQAVLLPAALTFYGNGGKRCMEILSQPIELAQKVCGSQKPCPGDWRMTHHCVSVPCAEGVLL